MPRNPFTWNVILVFPDAGIRVLQVGSFKGRLAKQKGIPENQTTIKLLIDNISYPDILLTICTQLTMHLLQNCAQFFPKPREPSN